VVDAAEHCREQRTASSDGLGLLGFFLLSCFDCDDRSVQPIKVMSTSEMRCS
jgi:hypothetical protein